MASQWLKVPVIGGCKATGPDVDVAHLQTGELVSADSALLKPNEPDRVYKDVGTEDLYDTTDVIAGPFLLTFEGQDDRLVIVRSAGTSTEVVVILASDGSQVISTLIDGVATKATMTWSKNEYYLGTDVGNFLVYTDGSDVLFAGLGMQDDDGSFPLGITVNTSSKTNSSTYLIGDFFLYFLVEYDSERDVESAPIGATAFPGPEFDTQWPEESEGNPNPKSGSTCTLSWDAATIVNPRADKRRLYRRYVGNFYRGTVDRGFLGRFLDGEDPRGGLLAEFPITTDSYRDLFTTSEDPAIQYPQIVISNEYSLAFYSTQVSPRNFTVAAIFNDALIANDPATSSQILRFSPPGLPEYQPDPYFMYFATDRSDEIVGLRVINDLLVVLMKDSIWRVNYLPFSDSFSTNRGRVQEKISGRAGCVGSHANVVVETTQGQVVVWLSRRGLEMTNGSMWDDACPDFTSDVLTSGIENAVLVNNEKLYRLELYVATNRWDFYYHPSHLKGGRFKLMGPTIQDQAFNKGGVAAATKAWVGHSGGVYEITNEEGARPCILQCGYLYDKNNPFLDVEVSAFAAQFSGSGSLGVSLYGTDQNSAENSSPSTDVITWTADGYFAKELWERGKVVRALLVASGSDWSMGPLYYRVEFSMAGVA